VHPKTDPAAQAAQAFKKDGLLDAMNAAIEAHPEKTMRLCFQERGGPWPKAA
jgi:hypothetical protein